VAIKTRKQPEESTPRFDFDLAPERERIKKGGKLYEIRRLDDFGIAKQRRLDRDGREFAQLWNNSEDFDEGSEQDVRLKFLLDRIFSELLDAPEDIREGFKDAEKAKVVLDFSLAPLRELLAANLQQALREAGDQASTTTT
jgi:hypothetical protein